MSEPINREKFPRPIVVISKCLGFAHCRYDGQMVDTPFISRLQDYIEFRPVCPEVEIGLGIPRDTIRISSFEGNLTLHQPATGRDVTQAMQTFVREFLGTLTEVDGFILKSSSPTCGPNGVRIYAGNEILRGGGFLGGEIMKTFRGLPIEDERRLRHFPIWEHCITRLFTFARFREARQRESLDALREFHLYHELLLICYNPSNQQELKDILENTQHYDVKTVTDHYENLLRRTLVKQPALNKIKNVLRHVCGTFSQRDMKPGIMEEYLDAQTLMQPYPASLGDLFD